ncbi:MAG: Rap1a/Tai family immunity protein [Pseudomonadota bacterium]
MRRIFAVAMFAAPLLATADTGNELQQHCKSTVTFQNYCLGYIKGVIETHSSWRSNYEAQNPSKGSTDAGSLNSFLDALWAPPKYCIPDGVTLEQGKKVILKYFDDNPAELHMSAEFLIGIALKRAFPCRENK